MLAESILVSTGKLPVPLAGCFVLSATPGDKGQILYTPYAGIKKFPSRTALSEHIKNQLDSAEEDDDLLAFMSLSARKTLAEATDITVTFQSIEEDIFQSQRNVIENNLRDNDQAMVDELLKLPTLNTLLDTVLEALLQTDFPKLDQRLTLVNFYTQAPTGPTEQYSSGSRRWTHSMSLSEAVLSYYRHRQWPVGQQAEYSHPQLLPTETDQRHWQTAIKRAADGLIDHLSAQLQRFWNEASSDGATRRAFFSRAIGEKARADLLLKREAEIITPEQCHALQALIEPETNVPSILTLETVRLWEYPPNYIELAGTLMISQGNSSAFLYTPVKGFEVLKDYQDLKVTLQKKSAVAGHDDELYDLMSLEERQRFIGFDEPQVSGAVISGSIFTALFEAIIAKQLQNLEYAFQVFRHSDGVVNIQAYFDKALDIRSMISAQLPALETQERWSTRPVLSGEQPSMVLGDTAAAFVKTFHAVKSPLRTEFAAQPVDTLAKQRFYLEDMKPRLAHALSVGVRGEASLRELAGKLRNADWLVVDTVFNPDRPDRSTRPAVRGFYPDAFSLVLDCSGEKDIQPLANCVLLTTRGGLDVQHSGRAILWTPSTGLEVFETVDSARQQLNLRLLDSEKRLALLENLSPVHRKFHRRYSLNSLRLIPGNVLQHITQSAIDHFLERCELVHAWKLTASQQEKALKTLAQSVIDTNLRRASSIAQAMALQQSLPAWLGMAPVEELQLHAELLEQFYNNVPDDKDYLHGIKPLQDYVHETLTTLLRSRFSGTALNPDEIEITPNLSLAGSAQTLTEFALNHVNVAQGTGFKVASKTTRPLPENLDQAAVRQLLLSLNIQENYAKPVKDRLVTDSTQAVPRWQRFVRQVPWQLLHHAHELKLQQRLSDGAFDLIRQVLDMPDAVARATVRGGNAIVRPLQLIKTTGSSAITAQGLYLIGPGTGQKGSQVLYAPYHSGSIFTEFDNDASVASAFNTPGSLQDLLLRRLPDNERTSFANLFKSTASQVSEITFGSNIVSGNLLTHLFNDNAALLPRMLASRSETDGFADWETAKHLFSSGIRLGSGVLPGKLAYGKFLWQAYDKFKDSAEALQDHHWKKALRTFIDGTVQMISLGKLSLEAEAETPIATPSSTPVTALEWSQIRSTSPQRTRLQHFETSSVQLKDLRKDSSNGMYLDATGKKRYAPIAGKVYPVQKTGAVWRMVKGEQEGPVLLPASDTQLVIDPDAHTVHFGKTLSTMHNRFAASHEARQVLNIEARGMADIRAKFPDKANMIVRAVDLARYYAFNSLHNLWVRKNHPSVTRLDTFLKRFFDVSAVDTDILDKIGEVIVPICKALVDPDNDLLNGDRLVVGSNKYPASNVVAFVNVHDPDKRVHLSEHFFNQGLEWYESSMTEPFDVKAHAMAAGLIHEVAHQVKKAVDIVYVEARRPFSDLVETITGEGQAMKQTQIELQDEALSLRTPREELFAKWNAKLNAWLSFDSLSSAYEEAEVIKEITGSPTMELARDAFLDVNNPEHRINIILRNADSIALLLCEMGRQLDPMPVAND
ncbi:dermonecrotic toxin domain-containing protein [Pseudomonas baetica]|uniref:dermonecrotic toxin domain-containing protein n=1 Tax=Pseudomonas baetica TaxID=674054 RepID=UPI003EE8CFE7